MRILFDARTATAHFPGIGRYVRCLTEALPGELGGGDSLTLLLPPHHRLRPVEDARLRYMRSGVDALSPLGSGHVARQVARCEPDVVHLPFPLVPLRTRCPLVVTVHDFIPLHQPGWRAWRARLAWRLIGNATSRSASRIITVSQAVAAECVQRLGAAVSGRVRVIGHGVESRYNGAAVAASRAFCERKLLPDHYFLYVGSARPHKNIDILLKMMATGDEALMLPLVVAGLQSDTAGLRRKIGAAGLGKRVVCAGEIAESDMPALYGGARALLFPSLDEGFGLPLLEAMACGTPVICSAIAAFREIGGEAAVFVHPLDHVEWRKAACQVVASQGWHDELRARCLAHAAGFTWQKSAAATVQVYRECLGERP